MVITLSFGKMKLHPKLEEEKKKRTVSSIIIQLTKLYQINNKNVVY